MLKYTVGGLVAGGLLITAGFLILAQFNKRNAEAGPPPVVSVTVGASGVSPQQLEVAQGRLIRLELVNETGDLRRISIKGPGIEQLPLETQFENAHSSGIPEDAVGFDAGSGRSASMFVRFKKSGSFEVQVLVPGRQETARTATLIVD